jgi:hypothetical protein
MRSRKSGCRPDGQPRQDNVGVEHADAFLRSVTGALQTGSVRFELGVRFRTGTVYRQFLSFDLDSSEDSQTAMPERTPRRLAAHRQGTTASELTSRSVAPSAFIFVKGGVTFSSSVPRRIPACEHHSFQFPVFGQGLFGRVLPFPPIGLDYATQPANNSVSGVLTRTGPSKPQAEKTWGFLCFPSFPIPGRGVGLQAAS